jgi:hypothetical protein
MSYRHRVINKDRGIREATRVVGSAFAEAALRGRTHGMAGVALVRNPNSYRYVNNVGNTFDPVGGRVYYSSSRLYQLRSLPAYVGNETSENALLSVAGPNAVVSVPVPYDRNLALALVNDALYVSFPGKGLRMRVLSRQLIPNAVTPTALVLTCSPHPNFANLVATNPNQPFRIERLPKIDYTSEIALPRGYHINLNYSGNLDFDPSVINNGNDWASTDGNPYTWTAFTQYIPEPSPLPATDPNMLPVEILFDENGGIDSIYTHGAEGLVYYSHAPISLCICEDALDDTFSLTPVNFPADYLPRSFVNAGNDLLSKSNVQWLTINHQTGQVSPAENLPLPGGLNAGTIGVDQPLRILTAQGIARQRVNSTQ